MTVEQYIKDRLTYDPKTGVICRRMKTRNKPVISKSQGYVVIGIYGKQYRVHRVAWFIYYGSWPHGDIDHINCIRADNRIENLRICNDSQNQCNKTKYRGTSRYKGVDLHKASGLWRARIRKNYKVRELGYFATEEEAAAAYAEAAAKFHGEFARI
jgi:hypothetical protein